MKAEKSISVIIPSPLNFVSAKILTISEVSFTLIVSEASNPIFCNILFADASNVGLNFVNFPVNLGFRFWF